MYVDNGRERGTWELGWVRRCDQKEEREKGREREIEKEREKRERMNECLLML